MKNLKVGSKIVDRGKVYRVFKLEKTNSRSKAFGGRLVHYKPHFKESPDYGIVCSIPQSSLYESNIRKPLSKNEIDNILKGLSKKGIIDTDLDLNVCEDVLKENSLHKTAEILRKFYRAQKKLGEEFTKKYRDFLDRIFEHVVEEVALVFGTSLEGAREKVYSYLE